MKKGLLKIIFGVTALLVLSVTFVSCGSESSSSSSSSQQSESTETPKEESIKGTVSQLNALVQAKSYLETMPFSEEGLIKQLHIVTGKQM